jgi:hypothetical protein
MNSPASLSASQIRHNPELEKFCRSRPIARHPNPLWKKLIFADATELYAAG